MEEQDYIELQRLLSILRIYLLRNLGEPLTATVRDTYIKLLRDVDFIRKNAPVIIEEKPEKKFKELIFKNLGNEEDNFVKQSKEE